MSDETYRPAHGAIPPDPDATHVRPDAAWAAAGRVPATGEVLGGFVLHESLGHGGFAHVYQAESPADGVVALKILTNAESGARERFVAEAGLLEQLGGRGFPRFVRADLDASTPWFAMELVPGPTLAQVVREHGPLPRQDLLHVADDVSGALAVLQEEHYLHRDVKPANIIVSDGHCVLIDLGIAKGHGSQTSTHAAGTIAYMAPELFVRKPHPRSDVYSLGLLLIYCATGSLPADLNFAGRDLTAEDVGPVDPVILPLILAMTRQDPAERPPLHNIARAIPSLAAQQAPEPGLLHASETTHVERDVVTEVVTAGGIATGAAAGAVAGAAAGALANEPATQVMPPASAQPEQTAVFPPAQQGRHQVPPPVQPGYPTYAQPPAQQGYAQPGGHGAPPSDAGSPQPAYQQPPSSQQPASYQQPVSSPEPSLSPPPRSTRSDERKPEGDDVGWRLVSMLLGLIPAVLLGIAVYQVIRIIPGFNAMPDLSQAPLFRALGDWLLLTLNLPLDWSDTMANLAIPLLGLVLAGALNLVTRVAGRSEARRRRLWPYFLTIGVWVVVLAVQGIVAAVTEGVENAKEDISNSIEQGIQEQQDDLQEQYDETVQEQQEQAKESGEDFFDSIWPF